MAKKYAYAVMKSIFGDLWIGRTTLKPDESRVFTERIDAITKAQDIFSDLHPDFDPSADEEDDNYDEELYCAYEDLEASSCTEFISKAMEKHIIG